MSGPGLRAALGALIFASFARPVAAQAPWKTLHWEVSCTLELEGMIYSTPEQRKPYVDRLLAAVGTGSYASEAEARAAATQDLDSQLRRAEQCLRDDPVGIRQLAKDQLETSSRWLQSLGFGGPVISPFPAGGVAEGLFDPARAYRCAGTYCAAIEFIPHAHAEYVPADMYLSLGLRWPRALAPDIALHAGNADAAYTPTHELFHAIQFGYQNRIPAEDADLWKWLLEGSAELVQHVAAERWGGVVTPAAEHRYYDDALHEPPTTEIGPKSRQWGYGTWYFWDYLGRRLGSPDRIQYLREVLGQDLSAKNGLVGVDRALGSLGTPGLYDLYPAFVADRLREARFFRSLALGESKGCVPLSLELTLGDSVRVSSCPREMATEAFVVRTTVGAGRVGRLKVRIPKEADDSAYHLVVDGMRADVVDPLGAFPGGERNLFLTEVLEGRDSVLVRVVNVPKDLAHGMVRKNALVDVILTEVEAFWTMNLSGVRSGSFAGQHATARSGPEGINGINLLSDAGDSRHLIAITFGPRNPLTTTGTFTPAGVSIGLAMERIGTAEADGFCTPRSPDPSYPPVPSVTITALTDQYVAGVINGVMYRCDPGHQPDERNAVRIEFVATVCPRGAPCRR